MPSIGLNKLAFANREGLDEYNFELARSRSSAGVSAMVRIRNEETKIFHCLRSILPVFDEIVVVDNGSEDRTVEIVQEVQKQSDPQRKIRLLSYPHRLARFGRDHDSTPEDSVHSAVYYTNWALSHCSRRYVCKWDGDMVLVRTVREQFQSFLNKIQRGRKRGWVLAGQTVYRDRSGDFYLARGEVNREVEVFPCSLHYRFIKVDHWERLKRPAFPRKGEFNPVCFFELKFTDEDEFSHWSTGEWPSERKQREWDNYWRIRNGQMDEELFETLPRTFLDDEIGVHPAGDRDDPVA